MNTYLDCIPCFFKQALEAARLAGAGEKEQKMVIDELCGMVPGFMLEMSPPEMGVLIYGMVNRITGKKDPYKKIKEKSNKMALEIYPELKKRLDDSPDRLFTAVEMAIMGNVIDYGVKNNLNIEQEINNFLKKDFNTTSNQNKRVFDYRQFCDTLNKASSVLYLGDNSGEIVFDRILIEELPVPVIYVVRGGPIINDVTIDDAVVCGLDKVARVISSGCKAPGTILNSCSREFIQLFNAADMIISKGQGNFETLSDIGRPIYFLFKAKCSVVAGMIGCEMGSMVLKGKGKNEKIVK